MVQVTNSALHPLAATPPQPLKPAIRQHDPSEGLCASRAKKLKLHVTFNLAKTKAVCHGPPLPGRSKRSLPSPSLSDTNSRCTKGALQDSNPQKHRRSFDMCHLTTSSLVSPPQQKSSVGSFHSQGAMAPTKANTNQYANFNRGAHSRVRLGKASVAGRGGVVSASGKRVRVNGYSHGIQPGCPCPLKDNQTDVSGHSDLHQMACMFLSRLNLVRNKQHNKEESAH